MTTRNFELNSLLAISGNTSPADVLTNNRLFQLVDPELHDCFGFLGSPVQYGEKREEIEEYLSNNPGQYLLFDWSPYAVRDLYLSPFSLTLR